jgi:hypothetical protein
MLKIFWREFLRNLQDGFRNSFKMPANPLNPICILLALVLIIFAFKSSQPNRNVFPTVQQHNKNQQNNFQLI